MKIMVIHPDSETREKLVKWLEGQGHVVVEAEYRLASWPAALAEHEPDLLLLPQLLVTEPALIAVQPSFPDCQVRTISENEADWEETLRAAEDTYDRRQIKSRTYAEHRFVLHDEAFLPFASSEKLHRPKHRPGWEAVATQQEALFMAQLRAGREGGHDRAKQYFSILRRSHRQLLHECAYRLGHSSYKLSWLREEIGRWMTVLCCYLPDAQIGACPPPQDGSAEFVYLHHTIPPTYLYPITCVLQFHPSPTIAGHIAKAIAWSYTGQSDEELVDAGYRLLGVNAYLAEVAQAQISCMDHFLAPDSDFNVRGDAGRRLHRSIGTFLEFWSWNYLLGMGDRLRLITSRALVGEAHVERRHGGRIISTFQEFRTALRKTQTG